jgi:A/G-specific adenine glycosylase
VKEAASRGAASFFVPRAGNATYTFSVTPVELQRAFVKWFRAGHRDMPWRKTRDPYAIWVSEIMLQQTRVETVTPYFERWMRRFPTVRALAEAPLDDVLKHWSGLGYYARARNLHRAAQTIVREHGGRFPSDREGVRSLPGIGPYTAGAILSIAFDRPEPILDGNVARVLARLFRIPGAVDETAFKKRVWQLAAELVPAEAPGDFNQALMELGATVCTPRAPSCERCPVRSGCGAHADGDPERWPAPKRKAALRAVEQVTVLLERDGKLVMVRREPNGLWGGLWEPPTGELATGEAPADAAARVARDCTGLDAVEIAPVTGLEDGFEHVLTHRRMRFRPFRARARGRLRARAGRGYDSAQWLAGSDALELGVSAWTARLLRSLHE